MVGDRLTGPALIDGITVSELTEAMLAENADDLTEEGE
jgi:hypothetical protein